MDGWMDGWMGVREQFMQKVNALSTTRRKMCVCKSVCESEQNKAESYLIPHRFESDECFVIQSQLDLEERERGRES